MEIDKEKAETYHKKLHTNIEKKPFPYVEVIKNQCVGYTSACKHCFQCGIVKAECTHPNAEFRFCLFGWYSGDMVPDHMCYNFESNPNWKSSSTNYFYNRKVTIKGIEEKNENLKVDKEFYENNQLLNEYIYKPFNVYVVGLENIPEEDLIKDYPFLKQTPVKKIFIFVPVFKTKEEIKTYIYDKIINNINFCFVPNIKIRSKDVTEEYYKIACEVIDEIENDININLVTNFKHSYEIQRNEIMNLSWINSSYWAYDFKDSCKGKNIMCITGGPSLNNQLAWIKENKDKFIIFSATTVAKILFENGIVPDVIGNIDMKNINQLYLDEIKDYDLSKTKLLFELDSNYDTVNSYNGEKITLIAAMNKMPIVLNEIDEDYQFTKSGTVSNMIYSFACMCNPDAIYLAGYDGCYSGNKTHVEGTRFNREIDIIFNNNHYWIRSGNDLEPAFEMQNNKNENVYTTIQFLNYYYDLINIIKNKNIKTYDLSDIGLKKPNTEYIELKNININSTSNFSEICSKLNKKRFKDKFVKKLISNPLIKNDNSNILENHYSVYAYMVRQIKDNPYLDYNGAGKRLYDNLIKKSTKDCKEYVEKSLKLFEKRKRER